MHRSIPWTDSLLAHGLWSLDAAGRARGRRVVRRDPRVLLLVSESAVGTASRLERARATGRAPENPVDRPASLDVPPGRQNSFMAIRWFHELPGDARRVGFKDPDKALHA